MDKFTLDEQELEKINKLTRRNFNEQELYAFPIILCDNEIDRDGERFSISALNALKKLIIGKTGIFDHNPKGQNQTARVYDAKVVSDPAVKTNSGEEYTMLVGYAYMVRTDKNSDLIKEIEAGIKKEVSVSCAVKKRICSICGRDKQSRGCSHQPGRLYNSKLCSVILDGVYDAYEFSFVAVPAQPKAGVTKTYGSTIGNELQTTAKEDETVRALSERLKRDTAAAVMMEMPSVPRTIILKFCERLSIDELEEILSEITKKRRSIQFLDDMIKDKKISGTTENFKM